MLRRSRRRRRRGRSIELTARTGPQWWATSGPDGRFGVLVAKGRGRRCVRRRGERRRERKDRGSPRRVEGVVPARASSSAARASRWTGRSRSYVSRRRASRWRRRGSDSSARTGRPAGLLRRPTRRPRDVRTFPRASSGSMRPSSRRLRRPQRARRRPNAQELRLVCRAASADHGVVVGKDGRRCPGAASGQPAASALGGRVVPRGTS